MRKSILALAAVVFSLFTFLSVYADIPQVTVDNNSYLVMVTLNSSSGSQNVGAGSGTSPTVNFDGLVSVTINNQTVTVGINATVMLANGHSITASWPSSPSAIIVIELMDGLG